MIGMDQRRLCTNSEPYPSWPTIMGRVGTSDTSDIEKRRKELIFDESHIPDCLDVGDPIRFDLSQIELRSDEGNCVFGSKATPVKWAYSGRQP